MGDDRERYTFLLNKKEDKELCEFLADKSITKIAKMALIDYMNKTKAQALEDDDRLQHLINLSEKIYENVKGSKEGNDEA